MMISKRFIAASLLACLIGGTVDAASLRVSPIALDLKAGNATSTVRLWDDGLQPVNVQVRVFRWTKVNGKDHFDATTDVVASPPISKLTPGTENLIRVVRVSKQPINGTEAYRLFVDELPDARKPLPGQINVLVRHSIPVHFSE